MKNLSDMINDDMEVTVVNAIDTTSDPHEYGYDSWREYWEANGGNRNDKSLCPMKVKLQGVEKMEFVMRYRCPMCKKTFYWDGELPDCFDGCHVRIKGDDEGPLYITPLCHACNHKDVTVKVPRRMLVVAPPVKDNE